MKRTFTLLMMVSLYASGQSQITWTTGNNISTSTYSNMHPRIALDGAGNPLVIWGRMSDESVYLSRWTGSSFTTPMKINPGWLRIATGSWMGPQITTHGDTVYIVMKRTPEAT